MIEMKLFRIIYNICSEGLKLGCYLKTDLMEILLPTGM